MAGAECTGFARGARSAKVLPAVKGRLNVTCLLFAMARERAGVDRIAIELPAGARTGDACKELARRHPVLDEIIARSRVAVNGEFCEPERELSAGDEIAIIPPVSGG